MLMVMLNMCMCWRVHVIHFSMGVWLCYMYMGIVCAHAYVHMCVHDIAYVSVHRHDLVCSLNTPHLWYAALGLHNAV